VHLTCDQASPDQARHDLGHRALMREGLLRQLVDRQGIVLREAPEHEELCRADAGDPFGVSGRLTERLHDSADAVEHALHIVCRARYMGPHTISSVAGRPTGTPGTPTGYGGAAPDASGVRAVHAGWRMTMSDAPDHAPHHRPHTPPMDEPLMEFDLTAELHRLHAEATWSTGQNARTL